MSGVGRPGAGPLNPPSTIDRSRRPSVHAARLNGTIMDYDQLLNDFLDGTPLEYPAELDLFAALHASDQLRNDLRGSILTLRAATLDVAAGTPPAHVTRAIFNALGYDDVPSGARRLIPYPFGTAAGFIAGLIVAFFLFLQFPTRNIITGNRDVRWAAERHGMASAIRGGTAGDRSGEPGTTVSNTNALLPGTMNDDAGGSNAAGLMSACRVVGAQNTLAAAREAIAPPTSARTVEVERLERRLRAALAAVRGNRGATAASVIPSAAGNGPTTVEPIDAAPRPRSAPAMPDALPTLHAERADGHTQRPTTPIDDLPTAEPPNQPTLPLSVELRGIASTDIRTVPSQLRIGTVPLQQNTSIGVYYHLDDGDWVGLETGQEAYYQRFNDRDASGNIVQHEQDPTLRWFGVGYKRILETPTGLRPFAHAIIGGTLLGPTGRISLGTYYRINPALSVFGALELSATTFVHGSTWGASPKYGFSYGLSLTY